jgi:hypothetical protein
MIAEGNVLSRNDILLRECKDGLSELGGLLTDFRQLEGKPHDASVGALLSENERSREIVEHLCSKIVRVGKYMRPICRGAKRVVFCKVECVECDKTALRAERAVIVQSRIEGFLMKHPICAFLEAEPRHISSTDELLSM